MWQASALSIWCMGDSPCYQLIYNLVYEHQILLPLHHIVIFKSSRRRLDWAYKTADEVSKKESEYFKKWYDQNVRCTKLELGDLVLVRQKAFKGKHKVSDKWENTPYHVIEHVGRHLPVYKVQLIGETTKFRILHRNLLFPLAMRNESDGKQPRYGGKGV